MTEYWKSTPKHYCKYCNEWMADNKSTRQTHELGPKHKSRVDRFNKERREAKFFGEKNEHALAAAMRGIERSAKDAIKQDRQEYGQLFRSSCDPLKTFGNKGLRNPGNMRAAAAILASDGTEELRADESGMYTIRGQTYLEGNFHEDKIFPDVSCEVFVEALDRWVSAIILKVDILTVPNTDIVLKTYRTQYHYATDEEFEADPTSGEVTIEAGVKSDRIRLLVNSDGRTPEDVVAEAIAAEEHAKNFDENTGLGAWSTVSVAVYNEDEEESRRVMAVKEEEERQAAALSSRINSLGSRAANDFEDMQDNSAMNAYDPNRTGIYRGIKVTLKPVAMESECLTKGEIVTFKKRKVGMGGGRQVRTKLEDDED